MEEEAPRRLALQVGRWRVWLETADDKGESGLRVRLVGPHDHHSVLLCDAGNEGCTAVFKSTATAQEYESIEAAYESVTREEKEKERRRMRKADERTRDRRRRERHGAAAGSDSKGEEEEGGESAEKSDRHARRGGHRHRRHRRRHHDDSDAATAQDLSAQAVDTPHLVAPSANDNPRPPSQQSQQASGLDEDGFPTLAALCIRSVAPKLGNVESLEGIPIDMRQQMLRSLMVQRRHVPRSVVLNQDEDGVVVKDDEAMPLNAEKAEDMREEREEVLEAMLKLGDSCDMSELEFVKLMEVFCDTRRRQQPVHEPPASCHRWTAQLSFPLGD